MTPKRRSEMRNKGQTAKSQELPTALTFLFAIIFLRLYMSTFGAFFISSANWLWGTIPKEMTDKMAIDYMSTAFMGTIFVLLPFLLFLVLLGIVFNVMQVGWLVTLYPLKPDISKLNPVNGFKKFISPQPYVQLLQNIVKISIIVWMAYAILSARYPSLLMSVNMEIREIGAVIGSVVWEICWKLGAVLLILGIIDYIWQKWNFERTSRMSKKEVKDEQKNSEGDPQIKAKIKQKMRQAAVNRMMSSIPQADVVLTNPVHLAVALEYDSEKMSAPFLVAKGAGQVAERIKSLARESDVPILENKPLARALFRAVDIGEEIPADLYAAVSEVLVYVYQLQGRLDEHEVM